MGAVVKLAVVENQRVESGELIAMVEAIKMENPVLAHKSGIVTGFSVDVGDPPAKGALLCEINDDERNDHHV